MTLASRLQKPLALFLLAVAVFSLWSIATANAAIEIVPPACRSGSPTACNLCQLGQAVKNVTDLMIAIAGPIAVIYFIFAGIVLMTSGGNPGKASQAKAMATSAVIGLALVLGSWLIVNTIINFAAGAGFAWNKLVC